MPRLREIDLLAPRDGEVRQLLDVGGGEETGPLLHAELGLGLAASIHPGIDEAVRMVDAEPVELAEKLANAPPQECQRGTGLLGATVQRFRAGEPDGSAATSRGNAAGAATAAKKTCAPRSRPAASR